tara:strand:- start:110 stop:418 length:309 start_codon:yes stop_codon:yes gene_type:complete
MDPRIQKSIDQCYAVMRCHGRQETVPVLTPYMQLIVLSQDDEEFKEFLAWLKEVTGSFVLKHNYQTLSLYVREESLQETLALQETVDRMIGETLESHLHSGS